MMDEMKLKLSTKFMRSILAKFCSRYIRKKHGCKTDILINEVDLDMVDGKTHLHVDVDVDLSSDDFKKFMKSIGGD